MNYRSANAWSMHFHVLHFADEAPICLWSLAVDGWLLYFAASLSNCNCIVIAFIFLRL